MQQQMLEQQLMHGKLRKIIKSNVNYCLAAEVMEEKVDAEMKKMDEMDEWSNVIQLWNII